MRKKRILSLILALLMLIIATACGGTSKPAADSKAKGGTSAAESMVSSESRSQKESGKTDSKNAESTAAESKKAGQTEASGGSEGKKGTEDASSGESAKSSEESKAGTAQGASSGKEKTGSLDPDGSYASKDDVALYIHLYGKLPSNFITKKEAKALGWQGGSLEPYAPGKCIGGDRFGNYEGILPKVKGRTYYECDIDTLGKKKRGAKRIIYSSDGQIYYTGDHYETFELLYGEE